MQLVMVLALILFVSTSALGNQNNAVIGTWIGIGEQSVTVITYKSDGTCSGSLQTPIDDYSALYEGTWSLQDTTLLTIYTASSDPHFPIPGEHKATILDAKQNLMLLQSHDGSTIIFTRVQYHRPAPERPSWLNAPPLMLSTEFFRNAASMEEIDDDLWTYLNDLVIPLEGKPYRDQLKTMLDDISPDLRRYYLVRGFDWERESEGLEGCMMKENDELFIDDTIRALEELGAHDHARIIRTLVPIAAERMRRIEAAEAEGRPFDFTDHPFKEYEAQWDIASKEYNFYEIIFRDMKKYPEKYVHPNMKKP